MTTRRADVIDDEDDDLVALRARFLTGDRETAPAEAAEFNRFRARFRATEKAHLRELEAGFAKYTDSVTLATFLARYRELRGERWRAFSRGMAARIGQTPTERTRVERRLVDEIERAIQATAGDLIDQWS